MDNGMDREIGWELRSMRLEAGITQQKLAAAIGKPQSYVSKVEGAKRDLHLSEIADYADALGIEVDEFMRRINTCIKNYRRQAASHQ